MIVVSWAVRSAAQLTTIIKRGQNYGLECYTFPCYYSYVDEGNKAVSKNHSREGKGNKPMVKHMKPHAAQHESGQTVYERYLRTEELLSLQKPEAELAHHDELQFQASVVRAVPQYAGSVHR